MADHSRLDPLPNSGRDEHYNLPSFPNLPRDVEPASVRAIAYGALRESGAEVAGALFEEIKEEGFSFKKVLKAYRSMMEEINELAEKKYHDEIEDIKKDPEELAIIEKGAEFYVLYNLLRRNGMENLTPRPSISLEQLRRNFTWDLGFNKLGFQYKKGQWFDMQRPPAFWTDTGSENPNFLESYYGEYDIERRQYRHAAIGMQRAIVPIKNQIEKDLFIYHAIKNPKSLFL